MSDLSQYDEVMANADPDAGKKPWELIVDGKHTVKVKSLTMDENERGPWLDFEVLFPKWNATERNRWYINDNEVNMGRLKGNLMAINPKFESLSKSLKETMAMAKNGEAVIQRTTNTAKSGKEYVNYSILSFTPDEIPF